MSFFYPTYKKNILSSQLSLAKDLKEHYGYYSSLLVAFSLYKFNQKDHLAAIEPQIFVKIGAGSTKHNRYLYGSNTNFSGFTDFSWGLKLLAPRFFDRYYSFVEFYKYKVISDKLKQGNLLDNKTSGVNFKLTVGYNLL